MKRIKRRLYVVGRNRLLNQLMSSAFEAELDATCGSAEDLAACGAPDGEAGNGIGPTTAVLVDDSDENARSGLFQLLARPAEETRTVGALFNVDAEQSDVSEAIRRGVKGVFFLTDPVDRVVSGVEILLEGGIWIPQELLLRAATLQRSEAELAVLDAGLTMREIEILSIASTGATNDEIASRLSISTHTVKTHLYNIFHKIGVESRLQAVMWGLEHLRELFPRFASSEGAEPESEHGGSAPDDSAPPVGA